LLISAAVRLSLFSEQVTKLILQKASISAASGSLRNLSKTNQRPTIQVEECRSFIKDALSVLPEFPVENILAVAGTPTTLAAVEIGHFSVQHIDGYELSLEGLENWLNRLSGLTVQQKIDLGFPIGRADVMLGWRINSD
jgi:exopolyphosphatase/pppGpp-phosphohydrolase